MRKSCKGNSKQSIDHEAPNITKLDAKDSKVFKNIQILPNQKVQLGYRRGHRPSGFSFKPQPNWQQNVGEALSRRFGKPMCFK